MVFCDLLLHGAPTAPSESGLGAPSVLTTPRELSTQRSKGLGHLHQTRSSLKQGQVCPAPCSLDPQLDTMLSVCWMNQHQPRGRCLELSLSWHPGWAVALTPSLPGILIPNGLTCINRGRGTPLVLAAFSTCLHGLTGRFYMTEAAPNDFCSTHSRGPDCLHPPFFPDMIVARIKLGTMTPLHCLISHSNASP